MVFHGGNLLEGGEIGRDGGEVDRHFDAIEFLGVVAGGRHLRDGVNDDVS